MDSLQDKVILVAGAAGGVGEGIVRALLKQGAVVVALSREDQRLSALAEYTADIKTGRLVCMQGGLSNEQEALAIQAKVYKQFKNLDAAIASLGGWWQGKPLTSVDIATWNRIMTDNLTSHFLAAKMFIPLLNPRTGYYIHVNGYNTEQPYPMAAPVVMAAAAQKMMVMCLAEELRPTSIRVYEMMLGPVNTRSRIAHGHAQEQWYSSEEVGEYISRLLLGNTGREHELIHRLDAR